MTTLERVDDVYCADTCPDSVQCTVCPAILCPAHSDEFTTCVAYEDVLHHVDCASECIECSAALASDAAEEQHECVLREGW